MSFDAHEEWKKLKNRKLYTMQNSRKMFYHFSPNVATNLSVAINKSIQTILQARELSTLLEDNVF